MTRFFADKGSFSEKSIIIAGDDFSHISRVLRMKQGDSLVICDGEGTDYQCLISQITKNEAVCEIVSKAANPCEPEIGITLYQGMPKGAKMEYIIQKCVEIGAKKVVPFISERTVAKNDGKIQRWNKISAEAAKQSGRGIIPKVLMPVSFKEAIEMAREQELAIIAYEEEREAAAREVFRCIRPKSIAVFIGPEGGFEKKEVDLAVSAGMKAVSLGKRILRTETAGMALISNIVYEYGL